MKLRRAFAILCAVLSGPLLAADPPAATPYDLVIRNARVVDGTGSPWFRSDVAVRGDTIVAVAPSITGPAKRVIDAKGLVVSPGFIDVHTHAGRTIFQVPTADNYIRQGVTLIMEGADGAGPSMAGSAPTWRKPASTLRRARSGSSPSCGRRCCTRTHSSFDKARRRWA